MTNLFINIYHLSTDSAFLTLTAIKFHQSVLYKNEGENEDITSKLANNFVIFFQEANLKKSGFLRVSFYYFATYPLSKTLAFRCT